MNNLKAYEDRFENDDEDEEQSEEDQDDDSDIDHEFESNSSSNKSKSMLIADELDGLDINARNKNLSKLNYTFKKWLIWSRNSRSAKYA